MEQGLVSVCLHLAVNLQCSHYVNHWFPPTLCLMTGLWPGPSAMGWHSKALSSSSCFTARWIQQKCHQNWHHPVCSVWCLSTKTAISQSLKRLSIILPTDLCPEGTALGHQHWIIQYLSIITLLNLQLLLMHSLSSLKIITFPWLSDSSYHVLLILSSFFFFSVESSWSFNNGLLIPLAFQITCFCFFIPSIPRHTFPHPSSLIHILAIYASTFGLNTANAVFFSFFSRLPHLFPLLFILLPFSIARPIHPAWWKLHHFFPSNIFKFLLFFLPKRPDTLSQHY